MGVLTCMLACSLSIGLTPLTLCSSILFALASKTSNHQRSKWLAVAGAALMIALASILIWSKVIRYVFPQTS